MSTVAIVGLGLIGGSMALGLKKSGFATKVIGMDKNPNAEKKALALGLVDEVVPVEAFSEAAYSIVAVPVDHICEVVDQLLTCCASDTAVIDVGSSKEVVCKTLRKHPKRGNFIAAHPIAGTEFSGPEAAIATLFKNKVNIICDQEQSDPGILKKAISLFEALKMRLIFMESADHDKHIAYVSHISHISSFMLGKTVLEIEKNEKNIFDMAGSGFASTVRLAKSSPDMWAPIFIQNRKNILISLNEYIKNLLLFKELLEDNSREELHELMRKTNHIKEVLEGMYQHECITKQNS